MTREGLFKEILSIDVFDTHTHLIGNRLCARDFWDIAHYFWFLRELQAAGYPKDYEILDEEERAHAFIDAFNKTRNTSMNWIVRHIFKDLYGIKIYDVKSIREANEAVKVSAQTQDWAKDVVDRLAIKKIAVNREEDAEFNNLHNISVFIPRIDGMLNKWVDDIEDAESQRITGERIAYDIDNLMKRYKEQGCNGIMTTLPRFNGNTYDSKNCINNTFNTRDDIIKFVLHSICCSAERNGLFVQLFLGVENGWSGIATPVNDPERVVKLHGLFEKYECQFELVIGSEINNMDVIQAARIFTNVSVGGLWWFNFRNSTYRDCMQKRFEALPSSRCAFIVSDARCIEWCYGKILLVKKLLADFLYEQIKLGWIDLEGAIYVAEQWLYGSAAYRY